jgi:hypothetical protein
MRPDRHDQVRQAEQRRLAARRRVIPQPDRGIEIISVKLAYPPHNHHNSVASAEISTEADANHPLHPICGISSVASAGADAPHLGSTAAGRRQGGATRQPLQVSAPQHE